MVGFAHTTSIPKIPFPSRILFAEFGHAAPTDCANIRSMKLNEALLDERLAELEKARAWSPRVVSKLEAHIRSADDEAVFRINPLSFAVDKHISESEAIDLFLYATKAGLFVMDWLLLCLSCACVVESFRSLKGVHNHYHCNICQGSYEADLDDLISVTFTVAADIREIAFHHPENLTASD